MVEVSSCALGAGVCGGGLSGDRNLLFSFEGVSTGADSVVGGMVSGDSVSLAGRGERVWAGSGLVNCRAFSSLHSVSLTKKVGVSYLWCFAVHDLRGPPCSGAIHSRTTPEVI